MFDATARALASGLFGPGPATNAFLESFTIHARVLLQFFYSKSPKPDDVVAEDFFLDASTWLAMRGEMPSTLAAVNNRVGKEIAHLTYARQEVIPEAKGWEVPAIWSSLSGLVRLFVQHAPKEHLGPSWPMQSSKPQV
jgi:hypothetical protein